MKPKPRTIDAVLLDMDGLMVDSEPHSIASWEAVFAKRALTLRRATIDRMFGLRLREAAEMLVDEFQLTDQPSDLAREKTLYQIEHLDGNVQAMPGLYELLREIDRRGLGKAMATSGTHAYVDAILTAIGLVGRFEVIITGDDVAKGKPEPDVFLAAAHTLGRPPESCLVLEDAPAGVQAAKAAGMTCFAIPNEHTKILDLSAADRVLGSLSEVIQFLPKQT